jgi:hypothetical protein
MDDEGTIEENGTRIYQVKGWYHDLPTQTNLKNSRQFLQALIENSAWHQNEHKRFGNKEPRLSFATGEAKDGRGQKIVHRYGDISIDLEPWNGSLRPEIQRIRELRDQIEEETGIYHDTALVQRYRDGLDYNKEHYDARLQEALSRQEGKLGIETVYCLSLGTRRKFVFWRNSDRERFEYWLEDGDILVMEGLCQKQFTHELPKVTAKKSPDDEPGSAVGERISITWRLLGSW